VPPSGTGYFTVQLGSGNEWILQGLSYSPSLQVKAPAAGVISAIDTGQGSITILHNSRMSTRIRGITPTLQVGTYVPQGQVIGIVIQTSFQSYGNGVPFAVLLDNNIVCPLSFLSADARQQIYTSGTISQLCPNN
jgi:hypothetical protein